MKVLSFVDLGLPDPIQKAVKDLGFEEPTPIQSLAILLRDGRDVIGQAHTGTGKTAAYGIPIVETADSSGKQPQALVLCPTRELAIQVAEALQKYAGRLPGFHVLPIYGGQSYTPQLGPYDASAPASGPGGEDAPCRADPATPPAAARS